ncbi:MAG: TonB-dependent receptor [Campylobacterales bacterium]|nr:TonB-dependent receptor [Campylobacterales bacterium]
MFTRSLILLSFTFSLACAEEILTLDKIQVEENGATLEERRDNSIAKRLISGEELTQYGDLNALEILKRTPGVTIADGKGKKSAPGKGYTVVLIDGEETTTSKRVNPLEQISPDMIERIEVMTNGSAEYTAESMGGIVNIVLKVPKSAGQTIAKMTIGSYGGDLPMESLFLQREGKSGKLAYLFNVTAADNRQLDSSSTSKQSAASRSEENRATEGRYQTLNATIKLIYTPSSRDKYTYNGSIGLNSTNSDMNTKPDSLTTTDQSKGAMVWSSIKGEHHLSSTELLEWKLKFHQNDDNGDSTSLQSSPIVTNQKQKDNGSIRILGAEGIYSRAIGDHFIKTGAELKRQNQRDEVTLYGTSIPTSLNTTQMRQDKGSLYFQDEISVGDSTVVTPGVRYENVSRDFGTASTIDYFAPSVHLLHHLTPSDNIRASIAKTVKLPTLNQLSTLTDSSLERNDIVHPDLIGNANLTEEKALSTELRYEHYFENKGIVSVGGFYRNIDDKIENVIKLDAATSRYTQTPENAGQGNLWGVELELKKSLSAYMEGLGMFANATFQDSSLTNRTTGVKRPIKQTSNFLSNIGIDHTLKAYKLTYGAAYRYVGGYDDPMEYQLSQSQKGYGALDLYASKRLDKTFKFQLNVKNITSTTVKMRSNSYDGVGALSTTQLDKIHSKPQILVMVEGKW